MPKYKNEQVKRKYDDLQRQNEQLMRENQALRDQQQQQQLDPQLELELKEQELLDHQLARYRAMKADAKYEADRQEKTGKFQCLTMSILVFGVGGGLLIGSTDLSVLSLFVVLAIFFLAIFFVPMPRRRGGGFIYYDGDFGGE